MTPEPEFWFGLLGVGVLNALAVGIAWGTQRSELVALRKDMDSIKKALGLTANGGQSWFVRRDELTLLRERADSEHEEFRNRLATLEFDRRAGREH